MKRFFNYIKNGIIAFFSNFRQEVVGFITIYLITWLLNWVLASVFKIPTLTFLSEVEYIFSASNRFIFVIILAWLGIRIMLPNFYKDVLRGPYRDGLQGLSNEKKADLAVKIIGVFMVTAALCMFTSN